MTAIISGMVVGFLIWATTLIYASFKLRPWEELDVGKSFLFVLFFVGLGTCVGYLFS